jgi:hypothetical protein
LNKKEIINALTNALDEGILKIPDDLQTKDLLLNEAAGFMRTFIPTGKEQLNSDTETRHDDLIISLTYSVWYSVSRGEVKVLHLGDPVRVVSLLTDEFKNTLIGIIRGK